MLDENKIIEAAQQAFYMNGLNTVPNAIAETIFAALREMVRQVNASKVELD